MRLHCFLSVNSLVNAARSSLNSIYWGKFHGKGIKLKTFPQGYVISLSGVVVRYHKIPKISLGAYIFQRPFLRGLFLEGLIFGGAYLRREICVSKSIGLAL